MGTFVYCLLSLFFLAGLPQQESAQELTSYEPDAITPTADGALINTTVGPAEGGEGTNDEEIDQGLVDAKKFYADVYDFNNYWVSVVPWFALVINTLAFCGWGYAKADNVVRMLLMGLAVTDVLSLISFMDSAVFFWTDFDWSLQQRTDLGCKIIQYVVNGARNCSSYFILLFTIDRFLSIWYPTWRRRLATVLKVAIAMVVTVCLCFVAEIYIFYEAFYQEYKVWGLKGCFIRDSQRLSRFSSIFRNGLGFILPALLVAILNGLIIYRLRAVQAVAIRDPAESGRTRKAEAQNRSLTIMLITVSVFSFFVYLPKAVMFYMMLEDAYDYSKTQERLWYWFSAMYIVDEIAMLNYTCNFFFYCLSSRRYRAGLWKLLTFAPCRQSSTNQGGVHGDGTQTAGTMYSETSTDSGAVEKTKGGLTSF